MEEFIGSKMTVSMTAVTSVNADVFVEFSHDDSLDYFREVGIFHRFDRLNDVWGDAKFLRELNNLSENKLELRKVYLVLREGW